MGKVFARIDEPLRRFISAQQMFFVATAPLAADGHVNVSPKGLDSFRIIDDRTVVYADLVGSGVETVAHVRENGRIVLMFCAFSGGPKICRLHGRAEVIDARHADFRALRELIPVAGGLRGFIRVHCTRVSDSCGFGVPLFDFVAQRTQLVDWGQKKGAEELREYLRAKNLSSVDGLPGAVVETLEDVDCETGES